MLQNLIDIIAAPSAMIASSAGGTAVLLPIIFVLYALYLNFVSKFSFVQLGWKSWFSLVCCPPHSCRVLLSSTFFSLAPYVLICGIWSFFTL